MPSDPTSGSPVIVVQDLTKVFGRFVAVDHLRFTVAKGEIFGFLGPNGAGKSTTIRMLCGLLTSTEGTATVGGRDINRDPEGVRETIGYMSQKFSLYRDLTVAENVAFFGGVYGLEGQKLRERSDAVMAMAGLAGLENRLTRTLSGALQQRLALGCAVIHEPPFLFLDEPTSGVDPISRRLFWDLIRGLAARDVTVLVTTHFLDEAEFCDRLGFITSGRLVALDTPAALKREVVGEDLFEVALPELRGARERVETIPGVVAASYSGRRLRIYCRRGVYDAAGLERALRVQGLEVQAIEAVAVRLEDTFISLVQQQTCEAAA